MTTTSTTRRSTTISPFVKKLYFMLEKAHAPALGWTTDGLGFCIYAPDELVSTLLPKFFHHNKLATFQRSLHQHGFHLRRDDGLFLEYAHVHFQRGNIPALHRIQDKKTSKDALPAPRRAIVDEIEHTIVDIKRKLHQAQRATDDMVSFLAQNTQRADDDAATRAYLACHSWMDALVLPLAASCSSPPERCLAY
ncbi:Aste57867_8666 [Aphanomyces stellatus]|uniref:Aste57867_8666 protein n=1 Tax=Aphanomyces stellatus TaxID=120398 RepID=A0A485KL09_9STRA|nr:hypothetical protein As57867_008632 [Aphanomyces stellatus]VFT85552.1 Aste57867_8666 [Aphanomyces stellatus]